MALTVENFCGLIITSRLYSADAAKEIYQRWNATSADRTNLKEFTRWLVASGYLTNYQSTLLGNGYADNFFLDQYKILDRIGKGRMAGVYKAVHTTSSQVVAAKVLPPSKAQDAALLARFQREARLATQLSHPNVVRTFQVGEAQGLHYLVMEHLEGQTLEEVLDQRKKLTPVEAVRIAFLAALGLQHIHEKGLVHRDIKPGNLMLTPAPQPNERVLKSMVKILDIGLGRELFDPKAKETPQDLTSEGTILGTPDYLAPEQARDARRADIRADIYSLGCTLYHCLAGAPPFADSNPVRQIMRHATEAPRLLKEVNPEVAEGLATIVNTMLAKDPARRFQTPSNVANALKGFLSQAEPEPEPAKDESVELKTYLDWLHKSSEEKVKPTPPAPPPPVPPPPPVFAVPEAVKRNVAARPLPTAEKVLRAQEKKRKRAHPAPAAAKKPAAPAAAAASPRVPAPPPAPMPMPLPMPPARPTAGGASFPEPLPLPSPPPQPLPTHFVEVEPVTLSDFVKAPWRLPISRDVFMLLTGGLSVLGVVLLIYLLTLLGGD
jgi:serine/threonine protein kinase